MTGLQWAIWSRWMLDYAQQIGYVGTGISAAYVSNPANVNQDANYVRRVTFNVGRVVEMTATSVMLAQPLLAGAPAAGACRKSWRPLWIGRAGRFFRSGRRCLWRRRNRAGGFVFTIPG